MDVEIEAVSLRVLPYQEKDSILTLFSPQGLLKLFVVGERKRGARTAALLSPLTYGEYCYRRKEKGLHRFMEGSLLHQHIKIRDRYETIAAAESMISALLQSQLVDTPAPHLFHLFLLLLSHLPASSDPAQITTLFYLKILQYEGILQLSNPLEAVYRWGGERYLGDSPPGALLFTAEEEETLADCVVSRKLSELSQQSHPPHFADKIRILFQQAFAAP